MAREDERFRDIELVIDEDMVLRCFDVMRQLRPHLSSPAEFVDCWKRQQTSDYTLAAYTISEQVIALAGFYVRESLVHGKHLFIDDLIVEPRVRSKRFGSTLIDYLKETASTAGCVKVLLDTPTTNTRAQRFYLREHFDITAFRLSFALSPG